MLDRYLSEPEELSSLQMVVERLRSRQTNSTDAILEHHALHMTCELPGGRRAWKRDPTVLRQYERPNLWREWEAIKCPVLIFRGRQSGLLNHETAVKMRRAIPRARLAELEGGGHWFYQEAPESFEDTVRWFLDGFPS